MVRRLAHTEDQLVAMTLRVPPEVIEVLEDDIVDTGQSRNATVVQILDAALAGQAPGEAIDHTTYRQLFIRLPEDLHEKVKRAAGSERMPINSFIIREIESHMRMKNLGKVAR